MATILVVDDRQTNRELVVTLLGYAGHRLLEATEGEEGLEIARREHPDLIITDIVMPTMDGYEFARRVRADPSINSTQIIFHTSSYIVSETRRLAEACGVSIVLSKPIEPEIFLEKVNEALTLPLAPVVSPASEDFHLAHMRLLTDTLTKKVEQLEAEVIERKRAEAALQTSEELFRSAFQYSPIGMCITSVDGKLQTVNQSLANMLGYSVEELTGKHFNDITYSDDLEIGTDIVSRMISGEVQNVAFEKRYLHKSGEPVWAHVGSTLLRDTSGEPIHFITQILDITERKRAEEQNRFLANLVANISDAIIAVDLQQKIQSWNNGAESLYGWKEQEVLGRPSKDILDTDFIGKTRAAVTKQIMEQGSWSGEALQLHRDGTRIPVQSSVAIYKDSEGRPAGIVAVNSDITERKRAEEQLRQSEENFSKAFSSSPTALMITRRADGKYLELNKAYTSIVGYERSELIGRLTAEFNIFTNPDQRKEIVSQLVTNGSLYNYEAQIQNKSGELRTVLASLEQIQFNGEDCILTTIVDITERKRAAEALIRERGLLQMLVENLPEEVYVKDRERRFLLVNDLVVQALGVQGKDEVIGMRDEDFMLPDLAKQFADEENEIMRSDKALINDEHRPPHRSGLPKWYLRTKLPLHDETGKTIGLVGLGRDITERKQAEDAIIRSEKLASAGRLAATIAHEINNPLEAVTNLLYLMRTDPGNLDTYLRLAEQELKRVAHLTKQTLGFYRETSQRVNTRLAELLEEVLAIYATKLAHRRITVQTELDSACEISAFPGELRQVFSNLIANAADAMPEGGRLQVRLRLATDHRLGTTGARVTIADNGSGIAPATLQHIYEPFFTTKEEVGTGLGLWVTKGIVDKHEGLLRVRSSTGRERHGTVFTLFLPGAQKSEAGGAAA